MIVLKEGDLVKIGSKILRVSKPTRYGRINFLRVSAKEIVEYYEANYSKETLKDKETK